MKTTLFTLLFFLSFTINSQEEKVYNSFVNDFAKSLDKNFSEEQLNQMFDDYSGLFSPPGERAKFPGRSKSSPPAETYGLNDFKNNKLYTDNIDDLLRSENRDQRTLAYIVIGSAGDKSKENILLDKIKTETEKVSLLWAGMALLYLKTAHTTEMFDYLVKNEDFGDAHMWPLFILLNKDSLQQTAYNRINSTNPTAKIVAAQTLSETSLNAKTEELLKKAVKEWDIRIKGYAIYPLAKLRTGNLLEILKPLVDSSETKEIALQALANSPTEADRNYLLELAAKEDPLSEELLNAFYHSETIENLKYWLKLLYTNPVPRDYLFFVFEQPLIQSDAILQDLQIALQKINNPQLLAELVRALEGRVDDRSADIMIRLLKNEDKTVRYWTAATLTKSPSKKSGTKEIKELINKGLKD